MGIERVGQNSEEIPLGKTVTVLVPPHMIPTSRFPASLLTHHISVLTQDEAVFVVLCYVVCHTLYTHAVQESELEFGSWDPQDS